MKTNLNVSINRLQTTLAIQVCLAVIGLSSLMSFAVRGQSLQGLDQVKLSVDDPRPVAAVIRKLEDQYGWVITYEDPRFVHDSEIADVALQVRRDLDKYKPGEVPPVLVPRGGPLEFTYEVSPGTKLPNDPTRVVQSLLDAQTANSHGGRFRLEMSGKIMHVIPTAIKNSAGRLVPQGSVLDTLIALPPGERTVLQKLESICTLLSRSTGVPFIQGTIPDNWFSRHKDNRGAIGQKARDVLVSTFARMDYGTNLSWQLFYGPGTKRYVLNIHLVSK